MYTLKIRYLVRDQLGQIRGDVTVPFSGRFRLAVAVRAAWTHTMICRTVRQQLNICPREFVVLAANATKAHVGDKNVVGFWHQNPETKARSFLGTLESQALAVSEVE